MIYPRTTKNKVDPENRIINLTQLKMKFWKVYGKFKIMNDLFREVGAL